MDNRRRKINILILILIRRKGKIWIKDAAEIEEKPETYSFIDSFLSLFLRLFTTGKQPTLVRATDLKY